MIKNIHFILIFFILLVSCQDNISKEELIEQYNKHKSTVSIILSEEREEYLENTQEENMIYVFRKKIKDYSTIDKNKYNYLINRIDSKKIKTLIKNTYLLNENTGIYQINENNVNIIEYIDNIFKLINEREKNSVKNPMITYQEESFLNHPYTFYETIYLNPIYKFFDFFEDENIIIDDKITLIKGRLYEHTNSFKLFSKENNILIVKAIIYRTNNSEQNIEIYKIIFNISKN